MVAVGNMPAVALHGCRHTSIRAEHMLNVVASDFWAEREQKLVLHTVHTRRAVLWRAVGVQVPVALVQEVFKAQEGTADMLAKYDRFAMRSFVEDNRALVWCTGNTTQQQASMQQLANTSTEHRNHIAALIGASNAHTVAGSRRSCSACSSRNCVLQQGCSSEGMHPGPEGTGLQLAEHQKWM